MQELKSSLRIRDLVHGFVYLSDVEVSVINHPLFQRLRNVRQNDVASYVYPSMNTSRFEHSLGCLSVAGRIALNIISGAHWEDFSKGVGIGAVDFQQVCRLYAMLHDIGHLPLSHLFEIAFEDYARTLDPPPLLEAVCTEWFGGKGFQKLHEAAGAAIVEVILDETNVRETVRGPVMQLMQSKKLDATDPLRPIKLVIDFEIDADRIDSTARDGLLAGGEYGNFDIDRLCRSVFLQPHRGGWRLAFSHKALSSLEALLLDRCRTHSNIHFHHRVVAMKVATSQLIAKLLICGVIRKNDFRLDVLDLRDDIWLHSLFREKAMLLREDESTKAAWEAVVHRKKSVMKLIWKNRSEYNDWHSQLREEAGLRDSGGLPKNKLGPYYELHLSKKMNAETRVFWLPFRPLGREAIPLTDERGEKEVDELLALSPLSASLEKMWAGEPEYYVVILDSIDREDAGQLWLNATVEWIG